MRQRAVWVAAMALMVAGCSTTTIAGTPAEKVLTKAELYDPCTLPAASLIAIGLDPKPIDTDFFGVPDPEWHLCLWNTKSFGITILSTTNTFREVKENARNKDLRPISVAHRNAVTYYDVSDTSREVCDVAFATEAGVIIVRAMATFGIPREQDPCVVAQTSANSLNSKFPG